MQASRADGGKMKRARNERLEQTAQGNPLTCRQPSDEQNWKECVRIMRNEDWLSFSFDITKYGHKKTSSHEHRPASGFGRSQLISSLRALIPWALCRSFWAGTRAVPRPRQCAGRSGRQSAAAAARASACRAGKSDFFGRYIPTSRALKGFRK